MTEMPANVRCELQVGQLLEAISNKYVGLIEENVGRVVCTVKEMHYIYFKLLLIL